MDKLISIIVPVYNVKDYLEHCIESLINQTYNNIEIILVNDGSTDSSGSICDSYATKDSRIKVYHIENGGSSIARNFGIEKSKGDYIGFVDSDDSVRPIMFEELIKFAITNDLKVVETSSVESHLAESNQQEDKTIDAIIEDKSVALKRIIKNKRFAVWRRLYHRSIVKNRFFIEGVLHQDVYYTIDILNEISRLGFFKNQFYIYNVQNPTSVIRSDYSLKKLNSINAGSYVVDNTMQYNNDIRDAARQYLFEFLTYHYDSLYFNPYLDTYKKHRKKIRETIRKHYDFKKIVFYPYAIVVLPPFWYRIFLHANKARIKIQLKTLHFFRDV